ncbi:hypothetical protein DAEQUDRAFT_814013 [Daedalea quercina L-15889]|uniref:Uncharacterized protein n=1 Tax=Daedalea quercina L-15889 TaxID=1314783 RepID=A0A165ML74_9APHY|nr:hypothetical protein DAEQUDRAFT_814013 [Daedalea quercina L-15889]
MTLHTSPSIMHHGRVAPLWHVQQSHATSEASEVERSSSLGQEGVTLVNDCMFTLKKDILGFHGTQIHFDDRPSVLEAEVVRLRSQASSLANAVTAAKALAQTQANDHKKQVFELEHLLDLAMTGISQLQARNDELEQSCTASERRLLSYEERFCDSDTMLRAAVSQVEQLTSETEKLADQKAALYDTLSQSLATSGQKQEDLEAEIQGLQAALAGRDAEVLSARKELQIVREEAVDKVDAIEAAWDKKHSEAVSKFERKIGFLRSERIRHRDVGKEHKEKAAYVEKQKDAAESALATCRVDLQTTSLKLKVAQEALKCAKAQTEAYLQRGQASERHIQHLESLLPIESKSAKRLLNLGDKLDKAMAKARTRTPAEDVTNRRVTSNGTSRYGLSYVPGLHGTPYEPVARANSFPVPDWSLSGDSSASFIKMHASNLIDVSEGEILFGSMGTTVNPMDKSPFQAQSKGPSLNKAQRAANRRRL